MLWIFVAVCIVLFIPVSVSAYGFYGSSVNRILFGVDMYNINVFGGYIRRENTTLFLHYKENKAKAIAIADAKSMKFDVTSLKRITVSEFKISARLKIDESAIWSCVFINAVSGLANKVLYSECPSVDYSVRVDLTNGDDDGVCAKITVLVNIFILLLILIKNIGENLWTQLSKKKT